MNNNTLLMLVSILLAVTNLYTFALMGYDKRAARLGRWRVSERALFVAAACFGALGGCAGMFLLRHKTRHWYFRVFFPLMLAAQIAAVVLLWKRVG